MMSCVIGAPPSVSGGAKARSQWFGLQSRMSGLPQGPGSSQGSFIRISGPFISPGSEGPTLLTAITRNLYLCIGVRCSTLIFLVFPSSVLATGDQVPLPLVVSMHSTMYFLIGVPPLSWGSAQLTTQLSWNTLFTFTLRGGVGLSMILMSMNFSHLP